MANFDPSTLAPSETGRPADTITIADLLSNVPGYHAKYDPGRNDINDYMSLMQLLTQPKHDAGPDARRAMGGMPAGPHDVQDPVQMQEPGAGQSLMALLFGGMK